MIFLLLRRRDLMKRVAVYCRVSTHEELQQHSLKAQREYYEKLLALFPEHKLVGIYAETKSGLNKKKRNQFEKLIKDCRRKKVDVIITKSVSRFARNVLDFLPVIRKLKNIGVDVYFENEKILLSKERSEFRMTVHATIAQEESLSKSRSIRWGLNHSFASGESKMANRVCYGYTHDSKGNLIVDEEKAKHVKLIFDLYLQGYSLSRIAKELKNKNILSPMGKGPWTSVAIDKMLSNIKYIGNVLLQKIYVEDLFHPKQAKNNGEITRYLYENNHVGIIDKEMFDAVQIEKLRRRK